MSNKLTGLFFILLLLPGLVFASGTGKIKGKVIDKDSKEALVGANVAVEGTSYGAATDVNGQFEILNVPAGVYSLKASFVGYAPTTVSNVRVSSDLTTDQNFDLNAEAVSIAGITIVAQKPIINKSATNAVRIVNGDDITNIPVRGVGAIVALQAGVVQQGGQLFIRGGRQDEVGYYIDGADARNVLNGTQAITVVPEALEELQVQAGGYNAEYGGANSGIVRQQLKSGTSQYKASLRAETDNFSDRGKSFLGGYSYGYSDYAATLSGPIIGDKIKFFVAGENIWQADPVQAFWDGFSFPKSVEDQAGNNPNPNNPIDPATGLRQSDVYDITVPSGNVPGSSLKSWAGNGTLTFDYNPLVVRLSASLNLTKTVRNDNPIRNILDLARLPRLDQSNDVFTAKVSYFPAPQTIIEVNGNYFDRRNKRYDQMFGDNYLLYGDSTANAAHGITFFKRFQGPQDFVTNGFPFSRPGSLNTITDGAAEDYLKAKQNYISGGVDITHQLTSHELKGGFNYQRYTIRNFQVSRLEAMGLQLHDNPDIARTGGTALDQLWRNGTLPNNYGYDIYGNEINSGFEGPKHPTYYSAYLQDKFEVGDLVINAGLRFDSFDNDDHAWLDPANPPYDPTNFTILNPDSSTRKVPAFKTVSPRLGFSFPVTDRTVFHVQYGKFVQSPQLSALYFGDSRWALSFSGRNFIAVPSSVGLQPERTTSYEIGFTQQFTDFASFDITTFYKDIQGQIQAVHIATTTGSNAASYNTLQNGDFATTKGLELTLRLRRVSRLQAALNYTLSDAEGTGSKLTAGISNAEQGTAQPTVISPLDFNQAHRGSINLDYRFGQDDGGPILSQLGLNVLFTFNSGHSYTKALASSSGGQRGPDLGAILADDDPRTRNPDGAINANTTPWVFNIDFKLDKTISIANMFDVNLYVYVQNLLNTKNVLNVYSRTGSATDDGFLTNPALSSAIVTALGPRYVDMYKAINLADRQHYWETQLNGNSPLTGGDLFGVPRQIRAGLSIII